jgi:CrcB protein
MTTPPDFTRASLLVLGGGGLGSWLRLMTGRLWVASIGPIAASNFPWGTLTVNILGSFGMGLLVGWLARHGTGGESWRLLLGVGVLGGFTTFSSFAMEFALFVERGNLGMAALYVGVSLAAGFTALFGGLFLIRALA